MIKYRSIVVLVIITFVILWLHWFHRDMSIETIKQYADELVLLVQHHYLLMVMGYMSIFIIATAAIIPITVMLTIASGYLFGIIPGLIYTVVSAVIGGTGIFLLVRYYVGNYIQRYYSKELEYFNRDIATYGDWYLLILQLMPFTPPLLPYAFSGLTKMSMVHMMLFSAIGLIPGTLIYVWSGNYLHTIDFEHTFFYWPMTLILLFFAIGIIAFIMWLKSK